MHRWIVILFIGVAIAWGNLSQARNAQEVKQMAPDATSDEGVLSAGAYHTCGVKRDGTLACWGNSSHGQLGAPSGTFTQVNAWGDHTCGIKSDGTLICWGDNLFGQLTNIPSGTFRQVSGPCGIKSDGTLACWEIKQVPIVTMPWRPNPNAPLVWNNSQGQLTALPSGPFTQISGSCGIKRDGTLACWGKSNFSRLTDIPSGTFTQISVGGFSACGVKSDSTLACWGYDWETNSIGQLTNIPNGTFRQVSAGERHTCGVRSEGALACWGMNTEGQLTNIPSGTFRQVSTGAFHTCALKSDGMVACWGDNSQWQLNSIPTAVFGRRAVSAEAFSHLQSEE
jgi:alpha-tubulin suppressor-like RCC1 family protein